jgi:LAO/AO transport system kinase
VHVQHARCEASAAAELRHGVHFPLEAEEVGLVTKDLHGGRRANADVVDAGDGRARTSSRAARRSRRRAAGARWLLRTEPRKSGVGHRFAEPDTYYLRVAGRRDWTRETLAAGVRDGDRRALARAITLVENRDPLAYDVVRELYPTTGNAYAVGLTGPPGVGKSSLISALVRHVRERDVRIGVVSVDPSSPFSQGALLGDRIRLSDHFLDPGVFIRSMGTRGHLGGLAEATLQALLVLDAAGKELVFLETVGTGQSEVEVIGIADTVLLVLMPGSGDSVQALKAGIMEIPDVIAINKLDHPAAKTMLNEVRSIMALDRDREWRPPIVLTEATRGENVPELWEKLEAHRAYLEQSGQLAERRARNLAGEVFAVASAHAKQHLEHAVADDPELRRLLDDVQRRRLDPLTAVREILEKVFRIGDDGDRTRPS